MSYDPPSILDTQRDVSTPSNEWHALERARKPCRDLLSGVLTLREPANAAIYLPRSPTETAFPDGKGNLIDPWLSRINAAYLHNALRDAIADAVGRVWIKEPKVEEGTPSEIEDFLDDVDGRGSSLQVFGAARSVTACAEGSDFVLVEFPKIQGQALTTREARAQGLTPTWRVYPPNSVIGSKFETWRNRPRLVQVRLSETYVEAGADEWSWTEKPQIRVLRAGQRDLGEDVPADDPRRLASFEVYRKVRGDDGKERWVSIPEESGTLSPQVDIPLVEWPTDSTTPFACPPPYLDVTILNLTHFRLTNLLQHGMQSVAWPVPWAAGWPYQTNAKGKEEPVPIGPDRLLRFKDVSAKFEIAEIQGSAFAAVESRLQKMEEQLARMTSDVLLSTAPGNLTATGEAIRAARASTRLGNWRASWQDAIANLFYFTAVYMEIVKPEDMDGWGAVELNSDFFPAVAADATATLSHRKWLNEIGVLSAEGAFESAQIDEIIPPTLDLATERKRIDQETPQGLPTTDPSPTMPPVDPLEQARLAAEAAASAAQ